MLIINIALQSAVNMYDPNALVVQKLGSGEEQNAAPARSVAEIENRKFILPAENGRIELETMRDVNSGWVTIKVYGGSGDRIVAAVQDHLKTWDAKITIHDVEAAPEREFQIKPQSERLWEVDPETGTLGLLYMSWDYEKQGADIPVLEASAWPMNKRSEN